MPDAAAAGSRDTRSYLLALLALTSVQVASTLTFNVAPLLAPAAAADLGVSPDDLAYFVSIAYLLCMVSAVSGGTVVGRLGPIRFSQICMLIVAAGAALLATGVLPLVVLAALIVGFGTGPLTVASSQLLSRVTPASLANVTFSIKQSGVPLGFAAGGIVVPVIAVAYGWQTAALAIAGLAVLVALAIQPLRGRYDIEHRRADGRLLPRLGEIMEPLRFCWRDPVLRPLCLASVFFSATQVTVVNFLILYGINHLALTYVFAGALLSAATLAGAFGRVFWGAIADLTRRPLLTLTVIGSLMGCASLVMATAEASWPGWLLYALAIVLGGTAVGWNGVFLALQARRAPPGRAGEITGATSLFVFGGPLLWPLAFRGLIALTGTYSAGFVAVGILVLLTTALLARRVAGDHS
jgi:MFS family permease